MISTLLYFQEEIHPILLVCVILEHETVRLMDIIAVYRIYMS